MSSNEEKVLVDALIATPPDAVWRALREPDLIIQWFGWDAESLAEEIDFIFAKGVQREEALQLLQFGEWQGAADRFELQAEGDASRLRVVRSAPSFPEGFEKGYDEITEGWIQFVEQLRFLLERHPGGTRRTLRLSGKADEKHRLPGNALGIDGLHDAKPGRPYLAELPTGDRIEGTIWHIGRHQLGVIVTNWNDALLVVVDEPKSESAPHGGGALTLTTFGMEAAAFDALAARLRTWWTARYPL